MHPPAHAHAVSVSSDWTWVKGRRMHARCARTAATSASTPIVLVHGLGVSSRYMLPTLRTLAPRWDVLAPDLPGFGLSDKPARTLTLVELARALSDWMDHNGLRQAVLLGNSLGCQVISTMAASQPERVRAAVLVGPTMDPTARRPLPAFARLLLDAPRERLSELPLAVTDYHRAGTRRIWQTFQDAVRAPVAEQLRAMHMPTLVVRGSRDPIVSQAWAQQVRDVLPDGRLVVIEGAPHAVNYSAPTALVQAVEEFLGTLPR